MSGLFHQGLSCEGSDPCELVQYFPVIIIIAVGSCVVLPGCIHTNYHY